MIGTNCKGCVFAQRKKSTQTGCQLGRDTKLDFLELDDENNFILDRFCTAYRPQEWLSQLTLEESKITDKIVMEEMVPAVGFIILFDHNLLNLENTLLDIQWQEWEKPKYICVVNDKTEYNEDIQRYLAEMFDYNTTKHHLLNITSDIAQKHMLIDEAFKHAENGWIYVTTSGEKIDRQLIKKLHKWINIDVKRLAMIKPYDDINGLVFQASLFKFLKGNGIKKIDEEVYDDRPFIDKVLSMSQDDSNLLTTWSKFNES